jgi:hypothetical protein
MHIVVPVVIFLSILPGIIETLRARRAQRKEEEVRS